jgi:putative transposase
MPWIEVTKMEEKKAFILRAFDRNENFSQLCKEFGISTKTGYKWKERFKKNGLAGLAEESRRPKKHSQQLSEQVVCKIVRIKQAKPRWGAPKIRIVYGRENPDSHLPSAATFERVLRRSGLTKPRRRVRRRVGERIQNRVEAVRANHVWTVDFKGWWYTPHGEKCEPITVRDQYSRYILSIQILEKGDISCVKRHFAELFKRYGLPEFIRSDNGVPFASPHGLYGLSQLSVWWLSLGISVDRIDPGKPAQNGAHERMHADMYRELEGEIQGDLKMHQAVFDTWRDEFNTERPHASLGMKTPSEFYEPSKRRFVGDVELAYPADYNVRVVNTRGVIHHKGRRIFISNAFNGYRVGLRYAEGLKLDVYFANWRLGEIDRINYLFTPNQEVITGRRERKVLPMS